VPPDQFPYPLERVVGVFRSSEQVQRAQAALGRAGLTPERSAVLHGEDDARSLDVSQDLDHVRRHVVQIGA
jgi:hypothetical protein